MNKRLILLVVFAIAIKLFLFNYALHYAPNIKFEPDSHDYLESGLTLSKHGVFAKRFLHGRFHYEYYRTPGYPLLLGFLHGKLRIPIDGVIVIQIILATLTALVTYKTAEMINPKLSMLSAIIILFDPSITLYSMRVLTETLFLFMMAIFMYQFIRYIKFKKVKDLIFSSLILAASTYVRPVNYYLGGAISVFILYMFFCEYKKKDGTSGKNHFVWKKSIGHMLTSLIIIYTLVGAWQYRNYIRFDKPFFSRIEEITLDTDGLFSYYKHNKDVIDKTEGAVAYFFRASTGCILSVMTRPASFKYLKNRTMTVAGKVFAYPWIVFWLVGFCAALTQLRGRFEYQFFLLIICYFMAAVLAAAITGASSRFRVPMMPFIAILSAYGWNWILITAGKFKRSNVIG